MITAMLKKNTAFNWGAVSEVYGEIAESSTPRSTGSRKREPLGLAWAIETPSDTLPKVTPSNPFK